MKVNLALIVAIGLGMAAALLNWLYLNQKSQEAEKVSFLGIAPDVVVRQGEVFKVEHFAQVDIPLSSARTLKTYVEPWTSLNSVKGTRATRTYSAGDLVRTEDLKTPATELDLRKDEVLMWVPVDRNFVSSLVTPGEMISFVVASGPLNVPPPKAEEPDSADVTVMPSLQAPEIIGPFRVLAIGNRLGGADVFQSAGRSPQQENVIAIAVNAPGGRMDQKAINLSKQLQQGGLRSAGVVWHGKKKD